MEEKQAAIATSKSNIRDMTTSFDIQTRSALF